MDLHYPTINEPASPEYVLAVIQDMHRLQCGYDPEADPDAVLTPETTVAEWRDACDLLEWRELGRAYNQFWGIHCSETEWRDVLEPADQRRLSEVCHLIAGHAQRPRVRPARLLGRTCTPAGAFLTIRSLLHQAGAPAREIGPSTPLGPYARQYAGVFLGPVSQLAPGALPSIRIRNPAYNAAIWGAVAGILCLLIGGLSQRPALTIVGALLFALFYGLIWFAARCLLPTSVEFGELRTFRDLADAITEGGRGPN